jgi:L-fuconolactonase
VITVDSHCHVSRDWFEPVESLLFQMDRNAVDYAIIIQIMAENDNEYQFECLRRYPGRFTSVVKVDEKSPSALNDLERLAEQGARGVRFQPSTRSSGADPLALWRKADELELPVSCMATSASDFAADEFAAIFAEFPNLPIVVEHLGGFNVPDNEQAPYPTRQKVFSLSRFPNAYIKIHGLGEFTARGVPFPTPRPFGPEIPPLLAMAFDAFGPDRIMWGSDYPPVSGREGYRNALQLPMEYFAAKGKEALEKMFGTTALKVFGPI